MKAAWEWVKKHWQIFVGVLIAALGAFFYVEVTRRPKVVPLPENPVKEEAEKEAEEKTLKAEQTALEAKTQIAKEHEEAINKHLEDAKGKTEEVRQDVDKTNEFLKNVGKDIRGGG